MSTALTMQDVVEDRLVAALARAAAQKLRGTGAVDVDHLATVYAETHDVTAEEVRTAAFTLKLRYANLRRGMAPNFPESATYEAIAAMHAERARVIEQAL